MSPPRSITKPVVKGGVKVDHCGGVKGSHYKDEDVVVSGEKGLWSVAEEALLPRSRVGRGILSDLGVDSFCGGFA